MDRIIGGFHAEKLRVDQIGETVFSFGCYVGEILVRRLGGRWTMPARSLWSRLGLGSTDMMVVEMPNGAILDPIGKAFRLLENGATDSVSYFYHIAVTTLV